MRLPKPELAGILRPALAPPFEDNAYFAMWGISAAVVQLSLSNAFRELNSELSVKQ